MTAGRGSRARSGRARPPRVAEDSGNGDHPASRPSPTTGGATGEPAIIVAGRPGRRAAGREPAATRSAYWTTRSSRCSAITTVMPEVVDQSLQRGQHSSAAPGSSAEVGSSRTRIRGRR